MRLDVQSICPDSRVFREDGEQLRDAILAAWSDEEPLDVDFGGVPVASISFFDESIAQLFLTYDAATIRKRIQVVGLMEDDRALLNHCIRKRRAGSPNPTGGASGR